MICSTTSPDLLLGQLDHDWTEKTGSLRADRDLHLVILGLDIQPLLLQRLDDLISDMESLHSLIISYALPMVSIT